MTTTTPNAADGSSKPVRRFRTRRIPGIFYVAGSMAIMGGLGVTDYVYGSKLIAKFDPPLVTVDREFCQAETCTNMARVLVGATALWTQTVQGRAGYTVHPFLNARYVVGSAGIESDLGASLNKKGSQYEGVLQFSRVINDTHFTDISAQLFETIRAAYLKNPDAIPALNEVMVTGKDKKLIKITPEELQVIFADPVVYKTLPKSATRRKPLKYASNKFIELLRHDVKLFRDPIIQTFAFMEVTHKALKGFTNKPHFMELPQHEQHAIMYLAHNLPRMAHVTLQQQYCEMPVSQLSPQDIGYFSGNSGIYQRDGRATPAQVKYRVANLQDLYLNRHGPKTGDPALKTSVRPVKPVLYGDSGFVSRFVLRPLINQARCVPTKT